MLGIVAERNTDGHRQVADSPPSAMIAVESSQRIILPRRSGESRFAPRQYCYAASKSGMVPSAPLTASAVSPLPESSDVQRDAA